MKYVPDEFVESMLKNVERLRKNVDKLDLELDSLELRMRNAVPSSRPATDEKPNMLGISPLKLRGRRGKNPTVDGVLEMQAEKGISSFTLNHLDSGKVAATIDGVLVILPKQLGKLLLLLADSTPTLVDPHPDALISWKDPEKLRMVLRKRDGSQYSRESFWNLLYQLRDRLMSHRINPRLVQTSDRNFVRFALRRQADYAST